MVADRVNDEFGTGDAEARKDLHHHLDHFRIHAGRRGPNSFRANLEKLAVAALLRTLAAEHGTDVVKLLDPWPLIEAMFDVGTHDAGGILRAQG